MRRDGLTPFRQCAHIYHNDQFISVAPLSGCSLVRPEDEAHFVYLTPEASDEALGRALLEALDRSRFFWPHDDPEFFKPVKFEQSYKNWEEHIIRRYGYKTKREAYKNMDWCWAKRTEGAISISPRKRDKPKVVIPETRDAAAVGAALRTALDH